MHILLRGNTGQRLRLVTGLILFAFALSHFLNHAVGLVSVEAMDAVQTWRTAITRSWPGMVILAASLTLHAAFALIKLAGRRTLRLSSWEIAQLGLGLAIPFLLLPHIVNTGVARIMFDVRDSYLYELAQLWPGHALQQSLLLLIVWTHGCIGLHFWLRLTSTYRRFFLPLFAIAILVPAAGLAGFMAGGREVYAALADPGFVEELLDITNWPDEAESARIVAWAESARIAFYGLLALVFAIVLGRMAAARLVERIEIDYRAARLVRAVPGPTLLEISRMHRIPHTSVCGGRGRCSTCRVEVVAGAELLPAPGSAEAETLSSIAAKPNVRLACQMRPQADLGVVRLVMTDQPAPAAVREIDPDSQGVERVLAVLFLDVRNFTGLSEEKLPYDVVFILNRLFEATGAAITGEQGWIDKYLGDGMMAVFGRDSGAEAGCRQALAAARTIDLALDELNAELASELDAPLTVGMGIHVGPLVLGRIGHQGTAAMTVIGRTVNAASRLESLSKDLGCQLVVSAEAARYAGMATGRLMLRRVTVRGLTSPLNVATFARARDLDGHLVEEPA